MVLPRTSIVLLYRLPGGLTAAHFVSLAVQNPSVAVSKTFELGVHPHRKAARLQLQHANTWCLTACPAKGQATWQKINTENTWEETRICSPPVPTKPGPTATGAAIGAAQQRWKRRDEGKAQSSSSLEIPNNSCGIPAQYKVCYWRASIHSHVTASWAVADSVWNFQLGYSTKLENTLYLLLQCGKEGADFGPSNLRFLDKNTQGEDLIAKDSYLKQ